MRFFQLPNSQLLNNHNDLSSKTNQIQMNLYKELLSGTAIVLTFAIFIPYIKSILNGDVRPHAFSWIIWGVSTFIVFFAQLADRGGVGAWPIGVSAFVTSFIAGLTYFKRGDTSIARVDWFFLAAAMSAIPFWFLTSDPLWAVIVLTISDIIGFGPTIRRSYSRPHEESVAFFSLFGFRNTLVILALENYSLTTVLFPAAVGVASWSLAILLLLRRWMLPLKSSLGEEYK